MDAFWRLYARSRATGDGSPRAVTASAIIKEAGVHRSTFYKYFRDVEAVLDAVETELIDVIKASAVKAMESKESIDPARLVRAVYVENSERLSLLLGPCGDPGFAAKVKRAVQPAVERVLGIERNALSPYVLEFLASGMLSAIMVRKRLRPDRRRAGKHHEVPDRKRHIDAGTLRRSFVVALQRTLTGAVRLPSQDPRGCPAPLASPSPSPLR